MDAGGIAEYDTPETLYHLPDGIFRCMCERSAITLDDIRYAAKARVIESDRRTIASPSVAKDSEEGEKRGDVFVLPA